VEGHVLDGIDPVKSFALAEAGMRGDEHAKMLGESLKEGEPHEGFIQGAVQVNKWRAITALANEGGLTGHGDRFRLATATGEQNAGTILQLFEGFKHVGPSRLALPGLILS